MKKREPLQSQIMTGYMLSAARSSYLEYIEKAENCLKQAIIDTNKDLKKEAVQNVDLGFLRRDIALAKAAIEQVEESHRVISNRFKKLGYRKLTTEDFKEFGVTRR